VDYAPGIPATRDVIPHVWQCNFGFCPDQAYSGAQNYIDSGRSACISTLRLEPSAIPSYNPLAKGSSIPDAD
jgi:hypothetical protein